MSEQSKIERPYQDGSWHFVKYEGLHKEYGAPAMYKANCDAWYSFEFSSIPTRQVEVIAPCVPASLPVGVPDGWSITRDGESIIVRREQGTAVELNHDGPLGERVMYGFLDAMLDATISIDHSQREFESLRSQRDKMAQILRDLVPGCKWRFMRPRIDQALQEVDGGN